VSRLLSRRPSLEEASRLDSRISSRERSHSTSSRAPEKHGVSMFAVEHQKGLVCNPGLQPRAQPLHLVQRACTKNFGERRSMSEAVSTRR